MRTACIFQVGMEQGKVPVDLVTTMAAETSG